MSGRLLLVVAVIATAAVAAAAGRELLGSDDDDDAPPRPSAYAGLTAQRLPIRLTVADAMWLTLDVSWVHRCGSEVNRTVRRRAVKVADDGSFSFRQLHVIPGVDGDEERQLLRLRGRRRSDGTLTGTWSAQVTQVNGQQVEHGRPDAGLYPCDPVDVAFRVRPGGSTRPPPPRTDRSGNLVVPLQDVPRRVAAGPRRAWVLDRHPPVVTAFDAATGRLLVRRSFPARGYRTAAGEGAAWLLDDDTSDMVLTRIDVGSHRVTVTRGERGTRRNPFYLWGSEALAVGAGAAWVIEGDRVLRADPRSGRVTRAIRLPRDPRARDRRNCRAHTRAEVVAVGGGAVWITATTEACGRPLQRLYSLSRIDPRTNRVTWTVALHRAYDRLVASRDGVWGTTYLRPALHRIDPRDGRPVSVTSLAGTENGSVRGLAAEANGVWVSQALDGGRDGVLLRIDPRTGKRSTVLPLTGEPTNVALGAGRVWVADTRARTLVGVRP